MKCNKLKILNLYIFLLFLIFLNSSVFASNNLIDDKKEETKYNKFGISGLPALNYNSDDGFGYGVIGTVYHYDNIQKPYKNALTFRIFMTTENIHAHQIYWDSLKFLQLPLRLQFRLGYFSTVSKTFCGFGSNVSCSETDAELKADELNLKKDSSEREKYISSYYKKRFISPESSLSLRWLLVEKPYKLELTGSWYGYYYFPGDVNESGPFPNSLYSKYYPEGEKGISSIFQMGIMYDTRDNEPAPKSGLWIESSIRNSSGVLGSNWDYTGINFILRSYTPLSNSKSTVLANRFISDFLIGDNILSEHLSIAGNSEQLIPVFGGQYIGRGIRDQRYIGKVKILNQTELRFKLTDFNISTQKFVISALTFLDLGLISYNYDSIKDEFNSVNTGFGGGLRIIWNNNFIIRFDMGLSNKEDYTPGIYININHLY